MTSRWVRGTVAVGLAVALLTGCGAPAGTDGALVDDWPAPPGPVVWTPKAGECHRSSGETVVLAVYQPVPCTDEHLAETAYLGAFTGEFATRETVPPWGSPAHRAAYADCVAKTTEFLGDDYRSGNVALYVGLPGPGAWTGGARWYRCDLTEIRITDGGSDVRRSGSLRGALATGGTLRHGCFTIKDKADDKHVDTAPVACTASHNGEFAGLYLAPDIPAPDDAAAEKLADNCSAVIAKYAGVPNDRNLLRRFRFVWHWWGKDEWARGNRAFHCTLWMPRVATRLMKGAGTGAFPAS